MVCRSVLEFEALNPDCLRLELGRFQAGWLSQSWLVARSDDPDALKKWRLAAKLLRERTRAGVTAINRGTGAQAVMKNFRYSEGALELEKSGVIMCPPQGKNGPAIRLGMSTEVT
ncbi:MAG: hypothetical protein R3C49_03000 [Planctomycetaceae bacterium]